MLECRTQPACQGGALVPLSGYLEVRPWGAEEWVLRVTASLPQAEPSLPLGWAGVLHRVHLEPLALMFLIWWFSEDISKTSVD